ncbi:MAG: hypothetical protein HY460_02420 [Parcubacteria group bacterium]|nr:hypothetical protein [Parcubacteria group bacterium]
MAEGDHGHMRWIHRILLGIGTLLVAGFAFPAHAVTIANPVASNTFVEIANAVAKYLFYIGLILAVLMFIYSGLLFITSGGDEEKLTRARHAFLWVIAGVTIVLLAKGITLILKDLFGVKAP